MKHWNAIVAAGAAFMLLPLAALSAPPAAAPAHAPKSIPAQATVAAKTAFATVPASSTAVKKALDAHSLAGAQKMVGKPGAFQGTVSSTYSPKTHSIVILDFDKEYKSALTAVVKPGSYAKFPDLAMLQGKHVLVSGTFDALKGSPQIVLSSPTQIKIIQ